MPILYSALVNCFKAANIKLPLPQVGSMISCGVIFLLAKNDVILLGQLSNPYQFFKNAKLFVHTAKYEGLPTVLLESLTLGTPVVAYDCPTGPKDILGQNSEYGKLIPLNDKDTFVEKVYELMNKNEKYENYRKLSLVRANDFSMESNKAKLKELIENINS